MYVLGWEWEFNITIPTIHMAKSKVCRKRKGGGEQNKYNFLAISFSTCTNIGVVL